jgi:hypothetical protein
LAATTTTGASQLPVALQAGAVRGYLGQFADFGVLLAALRGFAGNDERLANIGLFLPLGMLATLIWRRTGWAAAWGAALSFLVEMWQAFIGRGGELADVLHNSAGALLGAVLGVLVLRVATYVAPAVETIRWATTNQMPRQPDRGAAARRLQRRSYDRANP